jgi:hypothetical protein
MPRHPVSQALLAIARDCIKTMSDAPVEGATPDGAVAADKRHLFHRKVRT